MYRLHSYILLSPQNCPKISVVIRGIKRKLKTEKFYINRKLYL
uniref:Glutathione S-transferase n=1 Tax=Heterorhabditis bacteriophora TaxID=37862 RepID=A0A1I7WAZ6_HETBA